MASSLMQQLPSDKCPTLILDMMRYLICLIPLFPVIVYGQKTKDVITVRIGASSTNIIFKEAVEPSVTFLGFTFETGKTFTGSGPEFGLSKNINKSLFVELSLASFSGHESVLRINNNDHSYTLKGFQVPVILNFLIRDTSKRFRINLGGGVQYIKAHLKQFETLADSGGPSTRQINDVSISEFSLAIVPGVQFRILSQLYISFVVNMAISTTGRYNDRPCFSAKYVFK